MKPSPILSCSTVLTLILLVAPTTLLFIPERVRAIGTDSVFVVGEPNPTAAQRTFTSAKTAIESTITAVASVSTDAATIALYINTYVLEPLAFILSGHILDAITSATVGFVIGSTNGTGAPQFVQSLTENLQRLGDSNALAFFAELSQLNSPFSRSISSSLRARYLEQSSLGGFFAANVCSLSQVSPDINQYLAGDWSQGGFRAWFTLTGPDQNNPYILYQRAANQLTFQIGAAAGARVADYVASQGFLSWCGDAEPASGHASESSLGPATHDTSSKQVSGRGSSNSTGPAGYDPSYDQSSSLSGTTPGDSCTKNDGTPGIVKTPGSFIKSQLEKATGIQLDRLVRIGNIAPQINTIFGNLATILHTVNLANALLGGPESSGGLAGAIYRPRDASLFERDYLGVTPSSINANAAAQLPSGGGLLSRADQYESAWNTIGSAATAASSNVTHLASVCAAQIVVAQTIINTATTTNPVGNALISGPSSAYLPILTQFIQQASSQITAASTTLATVVAPVLAQAAQAASVVSTARAAQRKLQNAAALSTFGTEGAYIANLQALGATRPSANDIATAEQQAQSFGSGTASPAGSLNASGFSLVDKMSVISGNAQALESKCALPPDPGDNGATQRRGGGG